MTNLPEAYLTFLCHPERKRRISSLLKHEILQASPSEFSRVIHTTINEY
jgi:hypothetical protein